MPEPDVGVYVHVPFCERICPYCDFAVVRARPLSPEREAAYVDALCAELESRAGAFSGRRLASIYLGGGTPSLLQANSVEHILAAICRAFAGDPGETSLEVNPSSVEIQRLPDFRAAGIDRISLGVQSFDDTTLRRLGRAHRASVVHRSLEACREAGFSNLSVDLIVAAPGQTLLQVDADLRAALGWQPEHLSVYELSLEPGTPFGIAAARGRLRRPAEEAAAGMLERVELRLGAAGYERYEISSYARPGYQAIHNRRYWQRRPVLGLGVGAVSSDPPDPRHPYGLRRSNPRQLIRYLEGVAADGGGGLAEVEVLAVAEARAEAVFLSLRTRAGLDVERFAKEFGAPPRNFFASELRQLVAEGLLEELPGVLRLTPRGRMLSDSVFAQFV